MTKIAQIVQENIFFIALVGLIGLAFLLLRTRPTDVGSWAELEQQLRNGEPAIVEFYSNT
jgi:hypothetical protein